MVALASKSVDDVSTNIWYLKMAVLSVLRFAARNVAGKPGSMVSLLQPKNNVTAIRKCHNSCYRIEYLFTLFSLTISYFGVPSIVVCIIYQL